MPLKKMTGMRSLKRCALLCERVTGADSGSNLHREKAAIKRQLLDFAQGFFKVLLDVVRKGLERRDVNYLGCRPQRSFEGSPKKFINADQERSERLA